jgi:Ca2+/H+ antiporter, TMEM165/GDT1 family
MGDFIQSLLLIFLAEMGDKTQILAMTFATRYPMRKVLLGVLIGSFFNHGIAVFFGTFLTVIIPMQWLGVIASSSFLFFGYWALLAKEDEAETRLFQFAPVATVAAAFFIGELGDKTQLTAMALAARSGAPIATLAGTTLGMVGISALGIFAGKLLGDRVPEVSLKLVSATVFMGFGTIGLYNTLPSDWVSSYNRAVYILVLVLTTAPLMRRTVIQHRMERTPLKEVAKILQLDLESIRHSVGHLCADAESSGLCEDEICPFKEIESLIEEAESQGNAILKSPHQGTYKLLKAFEKQHFYDTLKVVYATCRKCQAHHKTCVMNQTRVILEQLIFGSNLSFDGNWDLYLEQIRQIDPEYHESHLKDWHVQILREMDKTQIPG